MPSDDMEVLCGDLRAKYEKQTDPGSGGFASVELYDADDYDRIVIGEESAVHLYFWLRRKLIEDGLLVEGKDAQAK